MKRITQFTVPSLIGAIAAAIFASRSSGFTQSLLLSTAEILAGFALALFIVNGLLNQEERKKAAAVLLQMVHRDIIDYHNLFIGAGQDTFGIPVWHGIIDAMNTNRRKPEALAPEHRNQVLEIIAAHSDTISPLLKSIDERFREVTYVLGWTFDPKLTRDCMLTRLEIDQLRTLLALNEPTPEQKLKKIELYFDIEADSTAVLKNLAQVCGVKLEAA